MRYIAQRSTFFHPAEQFPEENFSFLIAGDNGGFPEPFYSTQLQRNVAARMAEQSQQHQCKFVLELGDNFYFLGVKDVFDRRWQVSRVSISTDLWLK